VKSYFTTPLNNRTEVKFPFR